jgi:hypothetical protein
MLAAANNTLVYIGNDRIVRCDVVARSGEVRGFASQSRPIGVELPTLVEMALRLRDSKPGRVWVLSADLWTQRVTLSTSATRSLTPTEIGRALAFEIESLSGLSALDSDLGFQVVSSTAAERDYWVVQIPVWFREQIDTVVRASGGRLAGLVHPGGVPFPLSADAERWMRVESWPGAIISVGCGSKNQPEYLISQADSRAAWRADVDALATRSGPLELREQLADGSVALPLEREVATIRLDNDDVIAHWLALWASALSVAAPVVPVLRPVKRAVAKRTFAIAGFAVAAVLGVAAALDAWSLYGNIDATKAETAKLQARAGQLSTLKTQAATIDKQIAESRELLRKIKSEVDTADNTVASFRRRWPDLLTALSANCPEDVVVREITLDGAATASIHGWSLDAASCNQLASALASQLRPAGWSVSPAKKTVVASDGGREVCQFEVKLMPLSVLPPGAPPARSAVTQR